VRFAHAREGHRCLGWGMWWGRLSVFEWQLLVLYMERRQ
jgi:hypothetical protein